MKLPYHITDYHVVLASQSPRRQKLLRELGLEFEIRTKKGIEEVFPPGLQAHEIALHLAELKAKSFYDDLKTNELLITADTIVWQEGQVLNKPENAAQAAQMLEKLSGNSHRVITGVCLTTLQKQACFRAETKVYFKKLGENEINYYISAYQPFDKAGAYGIQEWIGYIGIEKIEGSYFNVVGLPVQRLYEELIKF